MFKHYVDDSNKEIYEAIEKLVDENDQKPWNTVTAEMIKCIGRFERKKGCFMSLERMAQELGSNVSARTLQRHDRYLSHIGLISKFRENKYGRTICVRRLKMPQKSVVPSLCRFSYETGIYSQTKASTVDTSKNSTSFFNGTDDILSYPVTTKCPKALRQNVVLIKEVKEVKIEKINNPYIPLQFEKNEDASVEVQGSLRPPSAACGGGIRRPQREGLRPHTSVEKPFEKQKGTIMDLGSEEQNPMDTEQTSSKDQVILPGFDEPIVIKPPRVEEAQVPNQASEDEVVGPKEALPASRTKDKKPRNQRERRAEAFKKHNRGHVVNPTGGPDIRLRQFDWKKARDIGSEGSVTTAQLWRHLHLKYEEAFGDGILEGQMPQDRYAIGAWFDKLKQRFMKTCSYQAENRDLADYFTWILDPARLDSMMGMGKLTASKNYLRVEQIQGSVYVQRFYNEVIRRKEGVVVNTANEHLKKWQMISDEVHTAFDFMVQTADSDIGIVISLARYGFALMLQFMMERNGMSEGQARKRIVNAMKDFLKNSKNFDDSVKLVSKALEATERFEFTYNKYTVWKEWREKCKGLTEEAVNGAKEERAAKQTEEEQGETV
jgi:hypothetical protein